MPADELANELEKALEPKRMVRISVAIFIAVMLFFGLVAAIKMGITAMNTVEAVSHDHAWFKLQIEKIRGLEHQIVETQEELSAARASADKRWISRSDDRAQVQGLANLLISLRAQYTEAITEYNVAADLVPTEILMTLPKKIDIKELAPSQEGSSEEKDE